MKSSFHRQIPFLPLFCNCQFRRLGSVQFLYSEAHIPAGWRLETRLSTLFCSIELFFISTLHKSRGKHGLLFSRIVLGVFTAPLHSSGGGADNKENNLSIVEACLPRARVYRGHVFTESLPSNGYTCHNTNNVSILVVRILAEI
jgi:hypothetical protein